MIETYGIVEEVKMDNNSMQFEFDSREDPHPGTIESLGSGSLRSEYRKNLKLLSKDVESFDARHRMLIDFFLIAGPKYDKLKEAYDNVKTGNPRIPPLPLEYEVNRFPKCNRIDAKYPGNGVSEFFFPEMDRKIYIEEDKNTLVEAGFDEEENYEFVVFVP